ncbi:MAG: hypothetical protein R3E32_25360 [Chitinophagales bacterium]
MSNPFKELDELEESIKAPASIKNKVMGSYGFITNIARIVEFIFGSLTNVLTGMLGLFDHVTPTNPQQQIMGLSSYLEENEDIEDVSLEEEEEEDE